jgi:hypothetical protein
MKSKYDLSMNQNGNLKPTSRSFNKSYTYITPGATNMNASPMFYVGNRTNVIWSSLSPQAPNAYVVFNFGKSNKKEKQKDKKENSKKELMYFGNVPSNIFGFNNNYAQGAMRPTLVPNVNISLDQRGNYKLIDNMGKQHKLYSDSHGNYVRHQNNKLYL